MHYQKAPAEEIKLVRCINGAIWDVIIDLRKGSVNYLKWFGIELSADNRTSLYIPKGFAHGFLTRRDNSEILHQMSEFYSPVHVAGLRWDDPVIKIQWPIDDYIISDRDLAFEYLDPGRSQDIRVNSINLNRS